MLKEEYRCLKCETVFEESDESGVDMRCPACRSESIERVENYSGFIEFLRSLRSSGGG